MSSWAEVCGKWDQPRKAPIATDRTRGEGSLSAEDRERIGRCLRQGKPDNVDVCATCAAPDDAPKIKTNGGFEGAGGTVFRSA